MTRPAGVEDVLLPNKVMIPAEAKLQRCGAAKGSALLTRTRAVCSEATRAEMFDTKVGERPRIGSHRGRISIPIICGADACRALERRYESIRTFRIGGGSNELLPKLSAGVGIFRSF